MNNRSAFRDLPQFLLAILFMVLFLAVSLWILRPFVPALIWATLIVVSTWQLMLMVQRWLGGKRSLAVLVMAGALLLIVVLPVVLSVLAVADHADDVAERLKTISQAGFPAAPAWVEKLPVVGARMASKWQGLAALSPDDLHTLMAPHVRNAASWTLQQAGGLPGILLHVLLTVILAVLLYAQGEAAAAGLRAFAGRLAGVRGVQSVVLAGQSIRAVALGVLATAFIQAVLSGLGLAVAGVPFAGALTALIFVLGVAQIPGLPVMLLALGWLYWSGHTWTALLFLPWAIFAGSLDNILKPILIKRGADLPLVLIFAGVIGGLLAFGVVGLFVGPVVLAIAYTQLSAWVADGVPAPGAVALPADADADEQLPLPIEATVTPP